MQHQFNLRLRTGTPDSAGNLARSHSSVHASLVSRRVRMSSPLCRLKPEHTLWTCIRVTALAVAEGGSRSKSGAAVCRLGVMEASSSRSSRAPLKNALAPQMNVNVNCPGAMLQISICTEEVTIRQRGEAIKPLMPAGHRSPPGGLPEKEMQL